MNERMNECTILKKYWPKSKVAVTSQHVDVTAACCLNICTLRQPLLHSERVTFLLVDVGILLLCSYRQKEKERHKRNYAHFKARLSNQDPDAITKQKRLRIQARQKYVLYFFKSITSGHKH